MLKKNKNSKGLTLIEILIALAIFAILATLVTLSLHNTARTATQTKTISDRTYQLNFTFAQLSNDLEQVIDRPIKDEAAFVGTENTITVTTHADGLERVGYVVNGARLERNVWPTLDSINTQAETHVLMTGVQNIQFRYYDTTHKNPGVFVSTWPQTASDKDNIPTAVEITLTLISGAQLSQIIPLYASSLKIETNP